MRLQDKVAIITGGGSGQGKASAIMFAEQGATVIVAEMNEQAGKETVKQITEAGQQAFFYQTDISDEENVRQLVETVHEKYGKIDILFNNAGIGFSALI